jgi:hypothetical protein
MDTKIGTIKKNYMDGLLEIKEEHAAFAFNDEDEEESGAASKTNYEDDFFNIEADGLKIDAPVSLFFLILNCYSVRVMMDTRNRKIPSMTKKTET